MFSDSDNHPRPALPYPPHVQRAWDHYCAETAGGMGAVDDWEQVPSWAKVECLRVTAPATPLT